MTTDAGFDHADALERGAYVSSPAQARSDAWRKGASAAGLATLSMVNCAFAATLRVDTPVRALLGAAAAAAALPTVYLAHDMHRTRTAAQLLVPGTAAVEQPRSESPVTSEQTAAVRSLSTASVRTR
ncbi:hypothetical protein AB0911_38355 [Streptomyces nigra]|uniref:hypothetical protein n=1 Tax=Streptomyces nigra TaxID=1827580 RepID=UPI0034566B1D